MGSERIAVTVEESVAHVELARPERLNALTIPLMRGLEETLRRASTDPDVRVVVLAGAGRGFWLPEPGHVVMYLDRHDEIQEDTARLTANVLLVERDGVITRLESRLSRDEMLAIAASTG